MRGGRGGFDLSSAWRRPASPVSPIALRATRAHSSEEMSSCLSAESTAPAVRGAAEPPGGDAHALSDPLHPESCSSRHQHCRPPPAFPPLYSPRKGAVLSGSLKPRLYCQRTCRHLPPLEHLVPSCWSWTENSTIRSPMNCRFRPRG